MPIQAGNINTPALFFPGDLGVVAKPFSCCLPSVYFKAFKGVCAVQAKVIIEQRIITDRIFVFIKLI